MSAWQPEEISPGTEAMRKVYHNEKPSLALPMALVASLVATAAVFFLIPFTHLVNNPKQTVELRQASVADLPPEVEEMEEPPAIESEQPPEAPPEPLLTEAPQQIPLTADLDVAVGSGGALGGFGEVKLSTSAEAMPQEAFDVGELEKGPEPISQPLPVYPPEMRKAKIEGSVTLVFLITEEGRVDSPRVENSTRPEFEKPVLDIVRKWRFRPGMKDGQPVRTYTRRKIPFRIPG